MKYKVWLIFLFAFLLESCDSDETNVLPDSIEIDELSENLSSSDEDVFSSQDVGDDKYSHLHSKSSSSKENGGFGSSGSKDSVGVAPEDSIIYNPKDTLVGPVIVDTDPLIEDTSTVSSVENLPACNAENEGEALMVLDRDSIYFCLGGEWSVPTVEYTRVTCQNGVLSVSKIPAAAPFFASGDSTDSSVATYRRSAMNLVGVLQKGPFLYGTSVKVVELDSLKRLADSMRSTETCVVSSDGSYSFDALDLVSPYVRIEASGYYRNELTGGLSSSVITLDAVADLTSRDTVNVNMLTHLTAPRVMKLVEDSGNNQPIGSMGARALNDVLSAFGINLGGNGGFNGGGFGGFGFGGGGTKTPSSTKDVFAEDLNLFGSDDYSAALLAVSIMIQSGGSGQGMLALAKQISDDIKGDGNWGDNPGKAKMADWLMVLDTSGGYSQIRRNMMSWNLGPVPDFEKYLRGFWNSIYQLETCNDMTAGTVKNVNNSLSAYFAPYYEHPDSPKIRFICDKTTKTWRAATDVEKDTYTLGPGEYDGQIMSGVINTDKFYVYESANKAWRAATSDDIMEFSRIEDVMDSLQADESVVFVLRHAERTDDTGKNGHLTDKGKTQSQSVGEKLKGNKVYFGNSGYTRTKETCEYIAKGLGQEPYSSDSLSFLNGEWYVKDNSKVETYKNSDNGLWAVMSRYAYRGAYLDAMYDLEERSEELINENIVPNIPNMGRVSVLITHDQLVAPLTVYCTNGKINLRYFENHIWVNYLAGVAIIVNSKGDVRYVPVKGLDVGTMYL